MSVVRRIHFEYLGDVMVDIIACDVHNPVFSALCQVHITPLTLAAAVGRLSEERATAAWIPVYAGAIIVGSPSPGLSEYTPSQWEEWLTSHPSEFATIKSIAEVVENFQDEDA